MFQALRLKEKILIGLVVVFIPLFTFYSQFIAPRFGDARINSVNRQIQRESKDLGELQSRDSAMKQEIESIRQKLSQHDEQVAKMRVQAEDFKQYILSDRYEVELYQYLFGRDARYSVIDLGNNPRRLPKGAYTEIVYSYTARGLFPDIMKMVKKIEQTSRSLSISTLKLERPRFNAKEGEKDDGTVIADAQIHVILSSNESALSFEEFKKNAPELEIKKIDGNPWDPNFGAATQQDEGPTGPVKKLNLTSVIYMIDEGQRVARFENLGKWFKQGDEFEIEPGKSFTTVRLMHIGGRYVVVKHLNKNITFKLTLDVTNIGGADSQGGIANRKEIVSDDSILQSQ